VAAYPSWALFAAGLGVLVGLLALPGVIRAGTDRLRKPEPPAKHKAAKGTRIRLREDSKPSPQPRVKLR
jgi:hypothetical protein